MITALFVVLLVVGLGMLFGVIQEGWYMRYRGQDSQPARQDPLHPGQWKLAEGKLRAPGLHHQPDVEWLQRQQSLTQQPEATEGK